MVFKNFADETSLHSIKFLPKLYMCRRYNNDLLAYLHLTKQTDMANDHSGNVSPAGSADLPNGATIPEEPDQHKSGDTAHFPVITICNTIHFRCASPVSKFSSLFLYRISEVFQDSSSDLLETVYTSDLHPLADEYIDRLNAKYNDARDFFARMGNKLNDTLLECVKILIFTKVKALIQI